MTYGKCPKTRNGRHSWMAADGKGNGKAGSPAPIVCSACGKPR